MKKFAIQLTDSKNYNQLIYDRLIHLGYKPYSTTTFCEEYSSNAGHFLINSYKSDKLSDCNTQLSTMTDGNALISLYDLYSTHPYNSRAVDISAVNRGDSVVVSDTVGDTGETYEFYSYDKKLSKPFIVVGKDGGIKSYTYFIKTL